MQNEKKEKSKLFSFFFAAAKDLKVELHVDFVYIRRSTKKNK
jgi:hypothetical protein